MPPASQAAPPRAAKEAENQVSDYFRNILPEPHRILGLQLRPLSLGRYRLLRRHEIAFVSDGEASAGPADLILGVIICALPCAEFNALLESGKLPRLIRHWSRKICPLPWLGRLPFLGKYWRQHHSFDISEKMRLFRAYLDSGAVMPKYWEENPSNSVSAAHWSHSMEIVLRGQLGWTAEEINEVPLSKAFADFFKHLENQGVIRLMTPEELNAPALTPEQIAALQAGAGGRN